MLQREKEIQESIQYWIDWGKQFRWVCYGCDDYESGTYYRLSDKAQSLFTISKAVRDDIDAAMKI